jgi:AcrR family transcriptional regulator
MEPLTPQRRRELTRSHLLDAAERIFIERGFHDASIDEVAAAAGFTKGAVYSNFKNKADLFIALTERRWDQQVAAVRQALAEAVSLAADERSRRFTQLTGELLLEDRDWALLSLEFFVYAARNDEARRRLAARYRTDRDTLAALIQAELDRMGAASPLPVEDLAATFLALFNGIALAHVTYRDEADAELLSSAMTFVNHAVDAFPQRSSI